jgi:hypothetical protein
LKLFNNHQESFFKKEIVKFLEKSKQNAGRILFEAHKKAQEAAKKNRKPSDKKFGTVSLSNTDTVSRAMRMRTRLYAKLAEIMASDLDNKMKKALASDVMMQLNKVEQKIIEIQRREKAKQEERVAKKNESEHVKRRRRNDLRLREAYIKKEYLYHADDGGMDPMSYSQAALSGSAVSFNFSGISGEVPMASVEGSVEVSV